MKKYHELGPSQQTKVKRQLKDTFAPAADHYASNRNLKLKKMIFEHTDGSEDDVVINAIPHRTYDNLNQVGMSNVGEIADAKVLTRVTDASYASLRSFYQDMPP